jgi:hypothetical protein
MAVCVCLIAYVSYLETCVHGCIALAEFLAYLAAVQLLLFVLFILIYTANNKVQDKF